MFPVKVMIVFPEVRFSVTPFTCRLDGCNVFFSHVSRKHLQREDVITINASHVVEVTF